MKKQVWNRYGSGMGQQVWNRYGTGMEQVWNRCGTAGMEQVWDRYGKTGTEVLRAGTQRVLKGYVKVTDCVVRRRYGGGTEVVRRWHVFEVWRRYGSRCLHGM